MRGGLLGVLCFSVCMASPAEDRPYSEPPPAAPADAPKTASSPPPPRPSPPPSRLPEEDRELVIPPGPVSGHFTTPYDRRKYTFERGGPDDGFARFWVSNGANKQELADADRLVPWCILDLRGTPVHVPLEAPPARDDETLPLLNARSTSKPKEPALLFALYAVSSGAKHRELVLVDAETLEIVWHERISQLGEGAQRFETLQLELVEPRDGDTKLTIEFVQHVLPRAGASDAHRPGPPLKQRFAAGSDGRYVRAIPPALPVD